MSQNSALTRDYIEEVIRTSTFTTTYASPLGLFTNVAPVRWVAGSRNSKKIIDFQANNVASEINGVITTEIPLIGGRESVYRWEHIVIASAIEHRLDSEHQGPEKANEVQTKISAFNENTQRVIDAVALSNNNIGLFGAQNVDNGNYVKIDETYATPAELYAKILNSLEEFVGVNSGSINVLLGSQVTKILRENMSGTRTYLEMVIEAGGTTGLEVKFAQNLVKYEAPSTLKKCKIATAILANEVHFINPAKIRAYEGKPVEISEGLNKTGDIQTIKLSTGLTGLHAFDEDAIVKLSLTQA